MFMSKMKSARNYVSHTSILCMLLGVCAGETVGVPGNVTVVGIFQVQRPVHGECGAVVVDSVMAAEAIKWYIGAVNAAGGLPFTVGFEAMKTCRVEGRAGESAVSLTNRVLQNSTDEIIVGVLGPEHSFEAATVSSILSSIRADRRLLQVSYSGAAQRLLNHTLYPNLYHVMPSDDSQIDILVQTMESLAWNRIAIVYEDNVYDGERAGGLKSRSGAAGICVAAMRSIAVDDSGYGNLVQMQSTMDEFIFGKTVNGTTIHPIHGVVIFASVDITNLFLSLTESIKSTDISAIFLLSEAAHLQTNVFELNGKLLDKTKGSLLVSPTHREIVEFSDYWKLLFNNNTVFEREVQTNPWLQLVYDDISGCTKTPCDFTPMVEEVVGSRFSQQPVSISYALSAVHTVMKAVETVHGDICSGNIQLCEAFMDRFRPEMMIDTMNDLRVDMTNDFSLSIVPSAPIPEFSFHTNGTVNVPSGTPSYQLFNLRSRETDAESFAITKVGDYVSGVLSLNTSLIRDYTGGTERVWPNIRKAQCLPGKECSECIQNHLADRYWYIPGDAYVVGVVPVHDVLGLGCGRTRLVNGYQVAESLMFALKTFNTSHGAYPSYFKKMNIGLIILNSCNNPVVVQRKILNLNKYGLPLESGGMLDLTGKIIGYVGGVSSDSSIAASHILTSLKHVMISCGAASALLSDMEEHPYFMRVVTADSSQAHAMMSLVKKLNGEYIQIIHTKGAYGEAGKDQVVIQAVAMKICVANIIMVPESTTDDYNAYYEQLRKYPFAKLVIVFVQSWIARPFLYDLVSQMDRGDFQFIGSQSWGKQPLILSDDVNMNLLGSFTFALEIAQEQMLVDDLRQMKPSPVAANPWARAYLETFLKCYFADSFDKRTGHACTDDDSIGNIHEFTPDPWTSSAYDSLVSLLIGAGSFFERVCGEDATSLCNDFINNPTGIFQETVSTVKLDIHGDGVPVKVFDELGDGTVGYNIYNIQKDADNPQKLVYNKVGNYDGKLAFSTDDLVYPLPSLYESRCPNEQACAVCLADGGNVPDSSSDDDIRVVVLSCLLAAAAIAIVILAIITWRKSIPGKPDEVNYLTARHMYMMEGTEAPGAIPMPHLGSTASSKIDSIPTTDN